MKASPFLSATLGLWLISIALTFGYSSHYVGINDIISGLLLFLFSMLSLKTKRECFKWLIGFVGVWLQFAPLLFWAPQALMYVNDTFVGAIAIILAFILTAKEETVDGSKPLGWSYNPSDWSHRIPTVTLAMFCWFFSRYMAAFQLGYIDHIWDPFFPEGTLHVITSDVSKKFPVSDAGLGALCYSLEFLLGWQGGTHRWYRMPWLVFAFAFLVIPVGIVSIFLIILQPVVVGAWCSWCLATAAFMLLMIVLTAGELAAVLQFLVEVRQKKGSVWQTFWRGATPRRDFLSLQPITKAFKDFALGVSFSWNLIVSTVLGIWIMFSPSVFGLSGKLAMGNYIVGPLIVAASIISFAEAFRTLRYVNIFFGLCLITLPWSAGVAGISNNLAIGLAIILLSFRKGTISQRYGGWEKFIK